MSLPLCAVCLPCCAAQSAWSSEPIDPQAWLPGYVTSRYGPNTTQGILAAWETMRENLYSTNQQWQVRVARPHG
jgi:hypothetical protein